MSSVESVTSYRAILSEAAALGAGASNHPRLRSARFHALPWLTEEFLTCEDLTDLLALEPNLGYLSAYTTTLAKEESSAGCVNTQLTLRAFLETVPDDLTQKQIEGAFSILMRYRVLDFALFHAGRPLRRPMGKTTALVATRKLPLRALLNCQSFLNDRCKVLLPELVSLRSNPGWQEQPQPASFVPSLNNHAVNLFTKVLSRQQKKLLYTVLLNFETAAFHLSYLLKGKIDLPDKMTALVAELTKNGEGKGWKVPNSYTVQMLRTPLQVAMTVSPLCLLIGKDLLDGPGRKSTMDYWEALAAVSRPPAIEEAEKQLRNVIFEVARGGDCVESLYHALDLISHLEVEAAPWLPPIVEKGATVAESPLFPSQPSNAALTLLPTGNVQPPFHSGNALTSRTPTISAPTPVATTSGINNARPPEAELEKASEDSVDDDREVREMGADKDGKVDFQQLSADDTPDNIKGSLGGEVDVVVDRGLAGDLEGKNQASGDNVKAGAEHASGIHMGTGAGVGMGIGVGTGVEVEMGVGADMQMDLVDERSPAEQDSDYEVTAPKTTTQPVENDMDSGVGVGTGVGLGAEDDVQMDIVDERSPAEQDRDDEDTTPKTTTQTVENDMDSGVGVGTGVGLETGAEDDAQMDIVDERSPAEQGRVDEDAAPKITTQPVDKDMDVDAPGAEEGGLRRSSRPKGQPGSTVPPVTTKQKPGAGKPPKGKNHGSGKGSGRSKGTGRGNGTGSGNGKSTTDGIQNEVDDEVIMVPKPTIYDSKEVLAETSVVDLSVLEETVFELDPLITNDDTPKITGLAVLEYHVVGSKDPFSFAPECHLQEDIDWWYQVDSCIRQNYHSSGCPGYLSDDPDAKSPIKCYSHEEYDDLSSLQVAQVLKSQHILIYDMPIPQGKGKLGFNAKGLQKLGRLDREMVIYDFSVSVPDGASNSVRARVGTPLDLLRSLSAEHPKALNALDFPLCDDPFGPLNFASDGVTWQWCLESPFCKREEQKPISDIRWGLAATGGGFHDFHADCEGFGTFVDPDSGVKVWVILTPKKVDSSAPLAMVDVFLSDNFSPSLPNPNEWAYDVVIIKPGMRFIMRPNTLHAVFTPYPSICRGGHFYATSTIQDTIYGLIHTFVAASYITNSRHKVASEKMLSRMLVFIHHHLTVSRALLEDDDRDEFEIDDDDFSAHIPDLSTFDGLLDLLTFCNFFELQNVLSDWMYLASQHSTTERMRNVRNRKLARQLVHWVLSNYDIVDEHRHLLSRENAFDRIVYAHLANQARALICYKQKAVEAGVYSDNPGCSVKRVKQAVEETMLGSPCRNAYLSVRGADIKTFAWTGSKYGLGRRSEFMPVDSTIEGDAADDLKFKAKIQALVVSKSDLVPPKLSSTSGNDNPRGSHKRAHSPDTSNEDESDELRSGSEEDHQIREPVPTAKTRKRRRG